MTPYKRLLPEYPSIQHLPWKPNSKGDKIATQQEASVIFNSTISVQEKIDGANCGMVFYEDHPVVRNRTKILRKGQDLKNPSQKQFASAWNWMYAHREYFAALAEKGPYSVYGEWMIQQHGMVYDKLPDWFIAYDLYDYEKQEFVDPWQAGMILRNAGFSVIELSFYGENKPGLPGFNYEFLEGIANEQSWYADEKREGIVVKVTDGERILNRFKMVRQGFEQGSLLTDEMKRNKVLP